MRLNIGLKRFFSYFFIGTLLLTTIQITVAGYEADENSWFQILTTVLAEEENEDAEVEENSKSKEYTAYVNHVAVIESNKCLQSLEANQLYFPLIREVFSPPPQA